MGALTQQGRRVNAPGAQGGVMNQTRAPLEAPANAAMTRFGGNVEQAGNLWNERAIHFQQEKNAVEVSKRIAELEEVKRSRVDPLLQLEGTQALEREGFERGVIDEADKIYADAYDEIRSKLESPDQLRRFDIKFDSRRNEGMNEVASHYAKQHQVVKKATFEAGYSQATTAIRKNWYDLGFLEGKIAEVKEDYNELHPGTNNGAVTDKIEQEMRVEYLSELLVMSPRSVGPILEKWTDEGRIPASVAETIRNRARTEDEKQESNKLAAAALEIQASTGSDEDALKWIRSKATTPEVASKANALFSSQIELERRVKLQKEKDFEDDKNLEFMEMWVSSPDKLTPDVVVNSGLKSPSINFWLEKIKAGDSPTSNALMGQLLPRAYGVPGEKPFKSFDEVMAYTMPSDDRAGTLSMKDAMSLYKLQLYNDRQMRLGLERDADALAKYSRNKSAAEAVAMLKDFQAQGKGGIDDDSVFQVIANFQTWFANNPEATGPEIIEKAKEMGGNAILDRWFYENVLGKPDIYPKDVLAADVGQPGAPYSDIVNQWDPAVRSKVDQILRDMRAREPNAEIQDMDQVRYRIMDFYGEDGVNAYKPMEP
jgi:hypothetical protein